MAPSFSCSRVSLFSVLAARKGAWTAGPEARSCPWNRVAEPFPSPGGSSGPTWTCAGPHPAPAHTGQPLLPGETPGLWGSFRKAPSLGRAATEEKRQGRSQVPLTSCARGLVFRLETLLCPAGAGQLCRLETWSASWPSSPASASPSLPGAVSRPWPRETTEGWWDSGAP